MVDMRVSEKHSVDARRINRKLRPIVQTELLVALEESAIDQDAAAIRLDEVFRAGDGPDTTEKCQSYGHLASQSVFRSISFARPNSSAAG
jgi:hypothetical protein